MHVEQTKLWEEATLNRSTVLPILQSLRRRMPYRNPLHPDLLPRRQNRNQNQVARAIVSRMSLDELFEQKGEVAKSVSEELEKVFVPNFFFPVTLLLLLAHQKSEALFTKSTGNVTLCNAFLLASFEEEIGNLHYSVAPAEMTLTFHGLEFNQKGKGNEED